MEAIPIITYSKSNIYFPNTDNLLTILGCVNPLNIDTYINTSFFASHQTTSINGALVDVFTKDHLVSERFMVYQITPIPELATKEMISYIPKKKGFFSGNFFAGLIQGTPLIALILLSLLSFILPSSIANILRYISIIGLVITYLYYAYKMIDVLYKSINNKDINYGGVNVAGSLSSDLTKLSPATVDYIQALFTSYAVSRVVSYNGSWYVKQSIFQSKISNIMFSLFKPQTQVEVQIEPIVQAIMPAIMALAFIPTLPSPDAS